MTAKEFLDKIGWDDDEDIQVPMVREYMIEFAKFHVQKAQEAASVRNRIKVTSGWGSCDHRSTSEVHYTSQPINRDNPGHGDCTYEIIAPDRAIVFEAYPLENIK